MVKTIYKNIMNNYSYKEKKLQITCLVMKYLSTKTTQNLSSLTCLHKGLFKFASKFVFCLREFSHTLHTYIQTFSSQNLYYNLHRLLEVVKIDFRKGSHYINTFMFACDLSIYAQINVILI